MIDHLVPGTMQQVVENGEGLTYTERYAISSLFAEAWLLEELKDVE